MKKIILSLISIIMVFTSCNKANDEGGSTINPDEKEVELQLEAPTTYAPGDETDAEKAIKNVLLLVFDGDGDGAKFLYSRYAWRKGTTGNYYRSTLKFGTGQTIYYAVNVKSYIDALPATVLKPDDTWATIRAKLVMDSPYGMSTTNGLPMWGRMTNVNITDKPLNDLGTVKLLRSVASADVYLNLAVPTSFTLSKGHLVFAANKGYLPFDPSKLTTILGETQASAPTTAPTGMLTNVDVPYTVAANAKEIANVFYMYDNDASLTPAAGANRQTKIILEGKWNDASGSGRTTFYPLAFRKQSNNTKLQVTRNTKYYIIVTKVNGDGFGTIGEAKDADDVNMEYSVIPWNKNKDENIIIDGPKFFSIEKKKTIVYRDLGSESIIPFTTNYALSDIKMKLNDGDAGVSGTLLHPRFKCEATTLTDSEGNNYTGFKFTARQVYGTTDNPMTLIVTAGRIKFEIVVTQVDGTPNDWDDGGDQETDLDSQP